jgi:UDP-glucose:(heptosyl)LPS alpha-1,3-glucosyltransferase
MNLAFCLNYYFPFGGLQRDFLRIAMVCQSRGHSIHVYTMHWEGERPDGFAINIVKPRGLTNHTRSRDFARQVVEQLAASRCDLIVGFSRMPGLDVYYAADSCYRDKVLSSRPFLSRFGRRFRIYSAMERAVFAPETNTEILLIAEAEKAKFIRHYQTPEERFHLLPPGIEKDRVAPLDAPAIRQALRNELGLETEDFMLLLVGSRFRTKGVDRAVKALSALPQQLKERTGLYIVGQDKPDSYINLARRLGVENNVHFLGGRPDIPRFLLGADLLVHPAYIENTGTVLIEAIAAGLPVLASKVCGYAGYIEHAGAGKLIPVPFEQEAMNDQLVAMLDRKQLSAWQSNALNYARSADIFSLPEKAADLIESAGRRKMSC